MPLGTRCHPEVALCQVAAEGHTALSPAAARRLILASADRQSARDRARHLAGSLIDREAQVLACLGEACPTRRSRPGCTCPKPGSRATSRGCWTSWAAPTAPRPACSPTTPRYRQPVARVGEVAGWNSGWVPGRPGCVLRPDVRDRRVRRASRARRESAAVAIMSLTRLVTSCCRISGCMGPPGLGGRPRAAGQAVPAAEVRSGAQIVRAVGDAYTAAPGNWAPASRPVRAAGGVYTGWKCHVVRKGRRAG